MTHRGRLDLRRSDTFAGDLERVVAAALDEPVAVLIDHGPVAVDPGAWNSRPVGLDVTVRILPEAARHARQRLSQRQLAHHAAHRISVSVDYVGRGAHAGSAEGRWLDRRHQVAAHDAAADLGAAAVVDQWQTATTDVIEE